MTELGLRSSQLMTCPGKAFLPGMQAGNPSQSRIFQLVILLDIDEPDPALSPTSSSWKGALTKALCNGAANSNPHPLPYSG